MNLWKLFAWYGGRGSEEMLEFDQQECDTFILIGISAMLSIAIILAGHLLFWRNLLGSVDLAKTIPVGIALVFALLYWVLLRGMEKLEKYAKGIVVILLFCIMGVNALLAGHELLIFIFSAQVEKKAIENASSSINKANSASEDILGLPTLTAELTDKRALLKTALHGQGKIPDDVEMHNKDAHRCEKNAARHPDSLNGAKWAKCGEMRKKAVDRLRIIQNSSDTQIAGYRKEITKLENKIAKIDGLLKDKFRDNNPKLEASAKIGFGRHVALWDAVHAGEIPMWAAIGLMFVILALDAMSFLLKLLLPDDAAAAHRSIETLSRSFNNQLLIGGLRDQHAKVSETIQKMRYKLEAQLEGTTTKIVSEGIVNELEMNEAKHSAASKRRAQRKA